MQPGMGDLRRMLALETSLMLVLICSIPTGANPVGNIKFVYLSRNLIFT
ncbi:unnamed protein product [Acanthoscelides obtectus]|uniref:Uncharacterized protein n=1 Tax=Acanthoscelides obtectus TaxID=200917 RepID=A0A9P0LGL6_ACAOB|nr:unnamed protein product [Acanthoscelides obtectus]CAK1630825.1 hypothetical protein AOBTE_LOCUS6576 [Acanthoscelides obtectus]